MTKTNLYFVAASLKFRHAIGKTYVYDYQAACLTTMIGVTNDAAKIEIEGKLSVMFHDRCNLELSFKPKPNETTSGQQVRSCNP